MLNINDVTIGTVVFRLWSDSDSSYEGDIQELKVIAVRQTCAILTGGYVAEYNTYHTREEAVAEQLRWAKEGVRYYRRLVAKLERENQ